MQYRPHENGPLTTISVIPGAVIIDMLYDLPGCHTRLHSHTFDHWMECAKGPALIEIDGIETIVNTGDKYFVAAHKQHKVTPLGVDVQLRCVHEHADIHPDKACQGIPLEWLDRLTDKVVA